MSVSVFAERLRNAMNSRGLKQVDWCTPPNIVA